MSVKTAPRTLVLLKNPRPRGNVHDHSILIENCKIWTGRNIRQGSILIQKGKISRIARRISNPPDERVRARGMLALPGLVDVHVHLRDMDLAYKEDFTTGTAAAAAGGFTTVLDMPNTQPPTDSADRLNEKMERARNRVLVDVGFHVAAVPDERQIGNMVAAGAFSLKLYLPSPISPLAVESDRVLARLIRTAARHRLPLTVHAEDGKVIETAAENRIRSFAELAKLRPPRAETSAILRMLKLLKQASCPVHFCHITLSSSLTRIRKSGIKSLSSEVTPHHLLLSDKSLVKKKWKAWMVPPLRPDANRKSLLAATARGLANVIASDHAPHMIQEKARSPTDSPPGIPGLETTLPLILTLANKGIIPLSKIIDLLSTGPARLFGLTSKGRLEEGLNGDVVLVDLKRKARINPETFLTKAKFSPFEGIQTQGAVRTTIVGGRIIYNDGEIVAKPGNGRVLRRR